MTLVRRKFLQFAAAAATVPRIAMAQTSIAMPTPSARALMALFGLKYPIFEAPHGSATSPELASAVSNAGAMGALAILRSPDEARDAVSRVRSSTKGPFFVNYILRTEPVSLRAALDAGAPIVQFSWGMPSTEMVSAVRASKARLGIQVTSAESARAAIDLGADYLVCQGTEAGGHVQANRGLYEILPEVLNEARQIPVVASGGIGNGQGIGKALLGGASAAMLGTRFVATAESNAHPDYKQAIIAAHAKDTALTTCFQDGWPNATHRVLRNRTFVMWDAAGCPPPGKRPGEGDVLATRANRGNILRYSISYPLAGDTGGHLLDCALHAGEGVGAVRDIPAAGDLVVRLWKECEAAG